MFPKTVAEQRSFLYRDVENLITPGFLTQSVKIQGVSVSLRSLNVNDLYLLHHWTHGNKNPKIWYVAASIWMFDGNILLGDKEVVPLLAEYLSKTSPVVLQKLYIAVLSLFGRSQEAMRKVRPFLFESNARILWRQANSGEFLDDRFFGIPGASSIGLNPIQKLWIMYNQAEDQRDLDSISWAMTRTIVSPHSPKGARKMATSEKTRQQRETDRRQRILDEFYYRERGLITDDAHVIDPDGKKGMRIRSASSPEELSDEFNRWVSGDEDLHDRIVREYKEGILRNIQEQQEARNRELQEAQQAAEDHAEYHGYQSTPLVGYTPGQLKDLLVSEGRGGTNIRKVYDNSLPARAGQWLDKPAPPPKPGEFHNHPAAKKREPNPNINDQIQRRRPSTFGK